MAAQKPAYRSTPTNPTTRPEPAPTASTALQDADELLDEIDEVLEENALEVVRAYVQRSGQ